MAHAPSSFINVRTIHEAEIAWHWTDAKLHDVDYHIKVRDSINDKVKEIEAKFGVSDDTRYCCQWEGVQIYGSDLKKVEQAAQEVARHLSRFKDAHPLDLG